MGFGDRPRKGVRLGSIMAPSFTKAYAQAWRKLLPFEREVAIPIVYLQRHTFELFLKRLLETALRVRVGLHERGDAESSNRPKLPCRRDWRAARKEHDFREIFKRLNGSLLLLELPALPRQFDELRHQFDAIEQTDPTRTRYSMVHEGGQMVDSFASELDRSGRPRTYADCSEIGRRLDELMSASDRALSDTTPNAPEQPPTELERFFELFVAVWMDLECEERDEALAEYGCSD